MFLKRQISILKSCDSEDWSNDAENAALSSNYILNILKQKVILNCNNISQYYCFTALIFFPNKYSLGDLFQKQENLSYPEVLNLVVYF